MTLEQQVSSVELSQKLANLGVEQESQYWWVRIPKKTIYDNKANSYFTRLEQWKLLHIRQLKKIHEKNERYSAFTVAELENLLPDKIDYDTATTRKFAYLRMTQKHTVYESLQGFQLVPPQADDNIADSRAKMLAYLLENNF